MKTRLSRILNFVIISVLFTAACATPSDDITPTQQPEENTEIEETEQVTPEITEEKTEETQEVEQMQKGNKVIVVVAKDRYQSLEFNPVADALQGAGYEIVIASDALGTAMGTTENTEVEIAFADVNTEEYIGIVLIGGSNSLWDNVELHALLNKMNDDSKMVGAICYGSVTLATAHVIGEGDTACWYNSSESDPVMEGEGVVDSAMDVTITGNIITGDGPNAAQEFAEALVDYLNQ